MDHLEEKVRQVKLKVQILDGLPNDDIDAAFVDLLDDVGEIKSLILKRREILEKNKMVPLEQKMLIKRLQTVKARLEYMKSNYPKGIIRSAGDSSAQLAPDGSRTAPIKGIDENGSPVASVEMQTGCGKTVEHVISATPKPRHDMEISVSYISNAEFQEIPHYMRGRLTVMEINSFIDVYNKTLTKKYKLLNKTRNSIKIKGEIEKFDAWKRQISSETKGLYFCTSDDIFNESGVKCGKKEFSLLTILRHTKRIKEIRGKKVIFYAACF